MGISLRRVLIKHLTSGGIVIDNVITTVVCSEVIGHGGVGMLYRNIPKRRIARHSGGFKQQLEVHHIVDDNRTGPSALRLPSAVYIPRLNNAGVRAEAGT